MVSKPSYTGSDEWRRALSVAESVKQTALGLQLEPKSEWLRQVIKEAAEQMRAAVLWAAAQDAPAGRSRDALRPLIVAADATRSDAALASYFLAFLRHEGLMPEDTASDVARQLDQTESGMDALSRELREELGFEPYAPAPP